MMNPSKTTDTPQSTPTPRLTLKRTVIRDIYEPLPGNIELDSRWQEPAQTSTDVTVCTMGSTDSCCC